jgi:hypothetical protein
MTYPPDPYSDDPWSWAFVVFRHIPGIPGYGVDTDGNVWSCVKMGSRFGCYPRWRKLKLVERKIKKSTMSYFTVHIRNRGKKAGNVRVHRFVLEAFVGPRPPGMQGCHNNGNSLDNRLANLRWGTHADNVADRMRHGTTPRGEMSGNAKLTNAQAAEIRSLHKQGFSSRKIAAMYGIHQVSAAAIARGERYASADTGESNDVGV